MKKLIFVLSLTLASSAVCVAQERDSASAATRSAGQEGRTKIRIEELPEGVKQALEDEDFKGWMINAAFRDARKDEYEVELKNGVDRQVVKFNEEGKRLKK